MKTYYVQNNIGKAKYTVSHHDGIKKHKDQSDFYDLSIFRNKKDLNKFIKCLKFDGYIEQ